MDWSTPLGVTSITGKVANPSWYPPESIRAEHAARVPAERVQVRRVEMDGRREGLERCDVTLKLAVHRERQRPGGVAQPALACIMLVAIEDDRQQNGEEEERHDSAERQREEM